MSGVLRLYRTPLREGEPIYSLGGIDQGFYADGVHKGDKKPQLQSVLPVVLEDGRLCWEILDSEENRSLCQALLPTLAIPPFAYSLEQHVPVIHQDVSDLKRGRGRPKKDAE